MAKSQTSKSSPPSRGSSTLNAKVPQQYKDHNLAAVSPDKEQFEPSEASPVRQHNKMAGGA